MSEIELRRQSRYTWVLVVFTVVGMVFMAKISRANSGADTGKPAANFIAGEMIEAGSTIR